MIGTFDIGSQYHYTMEPQTTVCIPAEDGIDVVCSTQWVHLTQVAVADALKIPHNGVNMLFRRIGGGYGAKISRATHVACAAAVACYLTNRPVRFVMSLESNMEVMGKRYALLNEYDLDVADDGKIVKMVNKFGHDFGYNMNEPISFHVLGFAKNCYVADTWSISSNAVLTDAPSHTYCRAPGTTEAIAMVENMMEHIARATGKDTLSVRLANMTEDHKMRTMLPDFLKDIGTYDDRQFDTNNLSSTFPSH